MSTTKISNLIEMATASSRKILNANGTNSNFSKIGLYMWIADITSSTIDNTPSFGEIIIEDGDDFVDAMSDLNLFNGDEIELFTMINRLALGQIEFLISENVN
jgi:hypothetical protein